MHAFHRLLALAVATVLLAATAANAQPRQPTRPVVEIPPTGTELFRALLNKAGIKPVKQQELTNFRFAPSDDLIVVAFGTCHVNVIDSIEQTLRVGGAALIASDVLVDLQPFAKTGRLDDRWIDPRITGNWVECANTQHVLHVENRPKWRCPFVVPILVDEDGRPPDPNDEPVWRIFAGDAKKNLKPLKLVATNAPSFIEGTFAGPSSRRLAAFPPGCFSQGQFRREELPKSAAFAVGGDRNHIHHAPCQFLALAGNSVFFNQMMLEPGTDNLELAHRTIEYLQGHKRRRCIFYENGHLVERFDDLARAIAATKPQMPIPHIPREVVERAIVDFGNMGIDWLQSNDVPNKFLTRLVPLPRIVWFFLLLASIYVCFYLLKRLSGTRKPIEVPGPGVPGAPTGPPGVFDRRQKELLRRNNVYEPVRDLVREFFTAMGIRGEPESKPPRLWISEAVRKPNSLRQAIGDFWKLAYGPPQALTVNRWREMEPYFERLRQAFSDGKWEFVFTGPTS